MFTSFNFAPKMLNFKVNLSAHFNAAKNNFISNTMYQLNSQVQLTLPFAVSNHIRQKKRCLSKYYVFLMVS